MNAVSMKANREQFGLTPENVERQKRVSQLLYKSPIVLKTNLRGNNLHTTLSLQSFGPAHLNPSPISKVPKCGMYLRAIFNISLWILSPEHFPDFFFSSSHSPKTISRWIIEEHTHFSSPPPPQRAKQSGKNNSRENGSRFPRAHYCVTRKTQNRTRHEIERKSRSPYIFFLSARGKGKK